MNDRRQTGEGGFIEPAALLVIVGLALVGSLIVVAMWALPQYRVWQQELSGKAKLAEAEWSRRIAVQEAQAELDSAQLLAESEIIRARGVAEANEVIGTSLQGNEAYLRYLWIQGLHDGSGETVYVATEAGLPILEATRGLR